MPKPLAASWVSLIRFPDGFPSKINGFSRPEPPDHADTLPEAPESNKTWFLRLLNRRLARQSSGSSPARDQEDVQIRWSTNLDILLISGWRGSRVLASQPSVQQPPECWFILGETFWSHEIKIARLSTSFSIKIHSISGLKTLDLDRLSWKIIFNEERLLPVCSVQFQVTRWVQGAPQRLPEIAGLPRISSRRFWNAV